MGLQLHMLPNNCTHPVLFSKILYVSCPVLTRPTWSIRLSAALLLIIFSSLCRISVASSLVQL